METLLKKTAQYLTALIILIGISVLLGWESDIEFLKRPLPHLVSMNPMSALMFILSGISLLMLLAKEPTAKMVAGSKVIAFIVALIGALRFIEVVANLSLGIDQLLFAGKLNAGSTGNISNHMAPNTAFNFLLLGLALLLSGYKNYAGKRFANVAAFIILAVGLFSFLGYFFHVKEFYGILVYLPMSVHSAICFVLIAFAVLCLNGNVGFMQTFTSPYAGGTLARRLIPAIIFIPPLLGLIRLWIYWKQPYSVELGVAALITLIVVVFFVLIWYLSTVLDKSDAVRAAMQEQLKQFEYFFNHSYDFSCIANTEGYFEIVNPSFKKVLGYFQNELSENPFLNFVHPDDIPATLQEYEKLKSGVPVINFVNRYRKKDGSYLWFDWNTSPNQVTGKLYCIARDITERKKAEDALNKLNEELEQRVKERTAEIVKANRLYAFISGINQSIVHITNEQELLDTACNIATEVGQFKMAWIGRLDENGILNRVSMRGDKTAAEKILKKSLDYNDPALKEIPTVKVLRTGKYTVNNDVQNDPAMLAWKDEFVTQGIEASISLPIFKFGKVAGIFGIHAPLKNFFDEQEIVLLEEAAGDISFALEVMQKEKLRREAEEEIERLNETLEERVQERTAELTEANKGLEAFSSTVSHDLRAPARAVTSFVKIIQQDYGDRMEPKEKELFAYIEDSGKRMSAIIDDLLKFARYGHEKLKIEPVNMTRLVEGIWLNISRTAPHHAELDLQELMNVQVDMSMIEQVVVNLLTNAIKYSSKKDKPVISIWCEQTKENVIFYFKDNGAGFDMKNYDRLFGAFQRFHSPRDFEGTGVGLTLVKRVIEKHGGTVGAEAKVGEGATFYFTVPVSN